MKLAPVKKYKPPKYPTHTEARSDPDLLRKLPSNWQKKAAVVAAAGLLGAMALSSCRLFEPQLDDSKVSDLTLNVAPIFVYGTGTGAMGCEMVAPPVFLSEQEALAVIKGEAETAGLNLTAAPPKYTATSNKSKKKDEAKYSWTEKDYTIGEGKVGLDLYDEKNGVAVAYINMEGAEVKYDGFDISVTDYYPRELAELSAEDFAEQKGDIAIGLFYDPSVVWEERDVVITERNDKLQELYETYNYEINPIEYNKRYEQINNEYTDSLKQLIEENLRAQVRDFIEWLQGQGII